MANVALTFNLIKEKDLKDKPVDSIAELDSPQTIEALTNAFKSRGHKVIPIEADEKIFDKLRKNKKKIDIVFNIAEGIKGESRESHVPSMLEMLGIPYVGSGPFSLALCLNKYRTKEILTYYGIPTPKYQVFHTPSDKLVKGLKFPLITKLAKEGSSMGLTYDSVVENEKDLRRNLKQMIGTYKQEILVEEFIEGKEFAIPLIGNDPPVILPLIEFKFHGKRSIAIFVPDHELKIFKEKNYEIPKSNITYECPPKIDKKLEAKLKDLAVRAFKATDCRDWCRLEIRVDKKNDPYLIELNPIAGIDPSYRFPFSAKAAGIDYNTLVNKILDYAIERYRKNGIKIG
jgi:D-alanine-D-alanine ligase